MGIRIYNVGQLCGVDRPACVCPCDGGSIGDIKKSVHLLMVRLVPAYRDRMVGKTGRTINSLPTICTGLFTFTRRFVVSLRTGGWLA